MGNGLQLASSCRCETADVVNCMSSSTSRGAGRPPPVVKVVVSSTGEVLEFNYEEAMKAAELMLLRPHHFVCHYSSSLCIGQRASPLASDHDLHPGRLYLLLPMHRLHSRLSHQDLAFLQNHASGAAAAGPGGSPRHAKHKFQSDAVTPMCLHPGSHSHLMEKSQEEEEEEEEEEEGVGLGPMHSHGVPPISTQALIDKWRSWRPNLQTINEKPPMRNYAF